MAEFIPASLKMQVREVHPQNNADSFSLKELQAFVGGFIECVTLRDGRIIVLDEEGKLKYKPINLRATLLWGAEKDFIVGDVLIANRKEMGE